MSLLILLVLPFIGSIIAALLPSNARNREAWLAGLIALVGTVQAALLYPEITHGGVITHQITWFPEYGLNLILRMDGLAWIFSLLITSIGMLVALYARYYMSPEDPVPRFFSFLLAFMGSMLGVIMSGNILQ